MSGTACAGFGAGRRESGGVRVKGGGRVGEWPPSGAPRPQSTATTTTGVRWTPAPPTRAWAAAEPGVGMGEGKNAHLEGGCEAGRAGWAAGIAQRVFGAFKGWVRAEFSPGK